MFKVNYRDKKQRQILRSALFIVNLDKNTVENLLCRTRQGIQIAGAIFPLRVSIDGHSLKLLLQMAMTSNLNISNHLPLILENGMTSFLKQVRT